MNPSPIGLRAAIAANAADGVNDGEDAVGLGRLMVIGVGVAVELMLPDTVLMLPEVDSVIAAGVVVVVVGVISKPLGRLPDPATRILPEKLGVRELVAE